MNHEPAAKRPASHFSTAVLAELRREVVRFLARRARDEALAEDLAQETLLRVTTAGGEFRAAASPKTWAHKIALNVLRDHYRSAAAREGENSTSWLERVLAAPEEQHPDRRIDSERQRHATRACLIEAADRLAPALRDLLVKHDLDDVPLARAAASSCTIGAAKVRLHRARRRLADLCRADCDCETGVDGARRCTPKASRQGHAAPTTRRREGEP